MGNFDNAIRLPSAKFPDVGSSVSGAVVEITKGLVPTFDDKGRIVPDVYKVDPITKENVEQVEVTLDTEAGKLVLHTDGAVFYAIGRALAEIGADDVEVGDSLTVTYTGDGEPTAKGRNAPKQYSAEIVKA